MADLHEQLSRAWNTNAFEPKIHHIRFPRFKNVAPGMRIDFLHPVTVLVGPNGTNKTSILRALQGAPQGNDLGTYWFGTEIDRIDPDSRHRFIYGRHSPTQGTTVEVVKTRIGRNTSQRRAGEINPDLFESSRPLLSPPDSMDRYPFSKANAPADGSATRWNTIEKNVVYLDFRSQLSSFDRAFHQSVVSRSVSINRSPVNLQNARKRRIRTWAKRLSFHLVESTQSDVRYGWERIVEPYRNLSETEKQAVGKVLGREYANVGIINHRYFDNTEGWTVLLQSEDLKYSEAFAGSGEYAAVMLVVQILAAPEKSLILLDEPEVSLHPGAQAHLMNLIARQALTKHHQVVISTHSPQLLRGLPPEAIKVLEMRSDSRTVDLPSQRASALTAFEAIGATLDVTTVVVEDSLARCIVERVSPSGVTVQIISGGAATLWRHYCVMWSEEGRSNLLLLLDGDQACAPPPVSEQVSDADLEETVRASLNNHVPMLPYGESEVNAIPRRRECLIRLLDWRRQFVGFLPFATPDEFLWPFRTDPRISDVVGAGTDAHKLAWAAYAERMTGSAVNGAEILTLQKLALVRVPDDDPSLSSLTQAIATFVEGQT